MHGDSRASRVIAASKASERHENPISLLELAKRYPNLSSNSATETSLRSHAAGSQGRKVVQPGPAPGQSTVRQRSIVWAPDHVHPASPGAVDDCCCECDC